jgi:very-short-patch-repair endonuclease
MARFIVKGQRISFEKALLSRQFRRRMTRAERVLWERLRKNRSAGLHFRRQQIICGYIADFYCHSAGVVVEVDGGIHRDRKDADRFREKVISALGLKIIRVSNREVLDHLEEVLNKIVAICLDYCTTYNILTISALSAILGV